MPIYLYLCPLCGEVDNVWAAINQPRMIHDECGRTMKRILSPTRINCDIEPYYEENIDYHKPVLIKSRRHRAQVLKENGLAIR